MNSLITILFALTTTLLLTSCENDVEEIKNPSTGKLLKRFEYYTDDSGQKIKDGEYVEWDATGKKIAELQYQDDSLNGSCIYYNENGSTSYFNYTMGKPDGEMSLKTSNGKWVFQENYDNGKLNGVQTYYYSNGKKQCVGSYNSGKQVGTWKYFEDDGKPAFTLSFRNGVCQELIGTWVLESGVTTFEFRKDGTFTLLAPYFRYSRQASVQGEGPFSVTRTLEMTHKNGMAEWEYELFEVEKNRLILINPNAEVEEAILELKRVNL